ncbi:mitotic checkpoint regulator, MAD2B-interacting-domain-containing protein [Dendryphion nanum]|uniref:Mitotic checkpoint regulator, MAD2B-interacting-domain-containing protein n=1 Tax=Dendryphion nanum TaxID=256645 RepID=A0A9P9D7D9_9PLEO|nr:mitotic checkpoint regulator, MAD2B-interacting-domain-containing protein [Dendryphion nanum]
MNLIAYSDSEDSETDVPQAPKLSAKPTPASAPKPSFQKVVDRSNPGKIKLSLPSTSQAQKGKDDIESDAPPAKRARLGGASAFGGFNAMLPAPKKPKVDMTSAAGISGSRGAGKRLGVGVNLKTGAEPAFQRRAVEEEDYDENGNRIVKTEKNNGTPMQKEDFRALLNLPLPKTEPARETKPAPPATPQEDPKEGSETKPLARPQFMPLSVARGKKKKPLVSRPSAPISDISKSSSATASTATATAAGSKVAAKPIAKPRVSLFSVGQEDAVAPTNDISTSNGQYQPLLYGVDDGDDAPVPDDAFDPSVSSAQYPASYVAPSGPQGLGNLASDLNLSERERRQLFGRKGQGPDLSGANVIDFNTDQEYAHNEKLRQQGETVQHNALKSITGTGKNSLRSLVNVATTQKDALEEHFASGRRNKKEAGNKYGW